MNKEYLAETLTEENIANFFSEGLGWNVLDASEETFGSKGTLGREDETELLLKFDFMDAIEMINPGLPEEVYEEAYEKFKQVAKYTTAEKILQDNLTAYHLIKNGIPVTYTDNEGNEVEERVQVFDFNHSESVNNIFLLIENFTIINKDNKKLTFDHLGFLNGIPLIFFDLKSNLSHKHQASLNHVKIAKELIPELFTYNAFIIIGNDKECKIGTITSKSKEYYEWKNDDEPTDVSSNIELLLIETCTKQRFLDIVENFTLFSNKPTGMVKVLARNHQLIGVNKSIEQLQRHRNAFKEGTITKEEAKKIGLFLHTFGSGKSYSIVFFCQKINRKFAGVYTFLLVTDRKELDVQLYNTFKKVGVIPNDAERPSVDSALPALIKQGEKFIFALIHKYASSSVITQRDNIIVVIDEAHHVQSGSLALNLRRALPNATFIGFSATPISKDDKITDKLFGKTIAEYDFKSSLDDGATVPLYYDNRGELLQLESPKISNSLREAIEIADMDNLQSERLKQLFNRDYPVMTDEKRLRAIAKDVITHFHGRKFLGKAMFVAVDKVTAVRMYDYLKEEWELYLEENRIEIKKIKDKDLKAQKQKEWDWSEETEIAVIAGKEQFEEEKFHDMQLDIETHWNKMQERNMEHDFKNKLHPFRLAIVCNLWLNGIDVPTLSTIYLDKPLMPQTLMQAISRANRNCEGKEYGLIVDYLENYETHVESLSLYAVVNQENVENQAELPLKPLSELKG